MSKSIAKKEAFSFSIIYILRKGSILHYIYKVESKNCCLRLDMNAKFFLNL